MPDGALTVQFVQTTGWVLFSAIAALSIALGAILSYHWVKFAMHKAVPFLAIAAYAIVSFLLLSVMFGAVIAL